jgi:hypothetical protein
MRNPHDLDNEIQKKRRRLILIVNCTMIEIDT